MGGVDNISLTNMLAADTEENLDTFAPQIICYSPYYDNNKLILNLN